MRSFQNSKRRYILQPWVLLSKSLQKENVNQSRMKEGQTQRARCIASQVSGNDKMTDAADYSYPFIDEEPLADRFTIDSESYLLTHATSKVDSEPPHGSNVDIPHIHECKQTLDVSAGTSINVQKEQSLDLSAGLKPQCQMTSVHNSSGLKPQCQMTSVHNSSGLKPQCQMTFEHNSSSLGRQCQMVSAENNTSGPVPQYQASVFMAMTSDHNSSELGIHDHSNEPSSSKLVPNVVPLAVKTATSRQEMELLFHNHIAMLRTTCK
ncbi:hypothetical protein Tco_1074152 [Tanacetum coccineum]